MGLICIIFDFGLLFLLIKIKENENITLVLTTKFSK
jgi:hypothetical protein